MDHIDQLITTAREAAFQRNRQAIEALQTYHGFGEDDDLDELIERATIEELFPDADEALVGIVTGYVLMARKVGLGVNTDLDRLSPEQQRWHEQAVSSVENSYVLAREVYDLHKGALTPEEQVIVERLVEVKFTR